MSWNIEMNRILPVKVSGVPGKMVPLEFSRLSTDSITVSAVLRNCDPSYPVLPRFVGLRMLMDPSKTQHRIWKDVDFRALKIDDSFVTNQWQTFLWVFSQGIESTLKISSCSLTNFAEKSNIFFSVRSDVFMMEIWLSCKFLPMNVVALIVTARNIPQIIECSSPSFATLDILFCLSRTWSFTRFTNSAASLPMMNFLNWPLLESWHYQFALMCHEVVLRTLRIAHFRREELLRDEDVLQHSPRSSVRLPWLIVRRSLSFPLLRRPNTVVIQFWIICWREALCFLTRLPQSIFSNNGLPRILLTEVEDDTNDGVLAIRFIIGRDFAVSWILLRSLRHCSRAHCRTEMADIEQAQQNDSTHHACNFLLVKMSASWFLVSMYLIWIKQPIKCNSVSPGNMSHCWTSSFNDHFDHCFTVFEHIQQSFLARGLDAWRNTVNILEHVDLPTRFFFQYQQVIPFCLKSESRFQKQKQ